MGATPVILSASEGSYNIVSEKHCDFSETIVILHPIAQF